MRLIDADALKAEISKEWFVEPNATIFNYVFNVIDNAPTVPLPDFKEGYKQAIIDGKTNYSRPQGEWLDIYESHIAYECSNCHRQMPVVDFNFCPNCGADMRGAE